MGTITTSCWVCGGWIARRFINANEDLTEWGTCVKCKNKVPDTGGESRVLDRKEDMHRVYVCAPFAGNIQANSQKAMNVAMKLAVEAAHEGKEQPFVFVPHVAFQYTVHDGKEVYREWAMRMCVEAVGMCDEIVVCGEEVSEGMQKEIEEANRRGVKITHRRDLG